MKALVVNEGSIFLFEPLDDEAKFWVEHNVGDEETQFFGDAVVVEHRYIHDLVAGFIEAGGEVS